MEEILILVGMRGSVQCSQGWKYAEGKVKEEYKKVDQGYIFRGQSTSQGFGLGELVMTRTPESCVVS